MDEAAEMLSLQAGLTALDVGLVTAARQIARYELSPDGIGDIGWRNASSSVNLNLTRSSLAAVTFVVMI